MEKAILGLILGVGMLTAAVPATAFHGAPYVARGVACLDGAPVCENATLFWGGQVGGGGSLQLIIHDPVRETSTVRVTLPGWENFRNLEFGAAVHCNFAEHTTSYVLNDSPTGGKTFLVGGGMELCFDGPNAGRRFCDLSGLFLQVFELHFACDQPA